MAPPSLKLPLTVFVPLSTGGVITPRATEALSSFGLPSVALEEMVAVLVTTVPFGVAGSTLTASVNAALPTPKLGFEQPTVPFVPGAGVLHDQPAASTSETKVVCGGSGSESVTAATSGPALVTVMS